ncbi:hypothetical protein ACFVU0_33210 [Streptomyces sp. NPDC058122]|uniref:hypothetical protein n=1 Tax=Streptomyces sp. NPDC058122 TaxID=3346349 RepID=UPI0036E617C3
MFSGQARLDGRSDLYAVGCLLHHMITGTPPFATDQPALLASRHLSSPPPAIADSGVKVPQPLQDLVTALLAERPDDCPTSAAEVYTALAPYLPDANPGLAVRRGLVEDPCRPFFVPQGLRPV